jgi:inorganic triphosphatase YgiF
MPIEVELKYRAEDATVLDRLATLAQLGPATLGPPRSARETDRYLDTADGRLASARWACRLRSRDGATRLSLKGPPEAGTGGGLHRRSELEGPANEHPHPTEWPPSEARTLLDRLRSGRPLREHVRLVQRRTEREVVVGGDVRGTLSLDAVRVESGGQPYGELHAVEVELAVDGEDDGRLITELQAALTRVAGLEPDTRTKLEHALRLIDGR